MENKQLESEDLLRPSPVCRQMGAEQGRTLSEAEKTKNKFNLNN